jgi:hypothetical protein
LFKDRALTSAVTNAENSFVLCAERQAAEKRKYGRRVIRYPAQIDAGAGTPLRECTLYDVSADGAQIRIGQSQDLPDEFTLVLSYDGATWRRCTVMWRSGERLGVKFLMTAKKAQASPKWAALAAQANSQK